jgi:glycosyltransferase involved in cell wall biosynthesis
MIDGEWHGYMIRLLCCIHDFRGRGAEKLLFTLLQKFNREKYHIGVFVYHDTFRLEIPGDVELLSAHLPPTDASTRLLTIFRMSILKLFALSKALNTFQPDVVLSVAGTNIPLIIAEYLFYRKTKTILSEHTLPSAHTKETKSPVLRFLINRLITLTYSRADLLIVPSKVVLDDLQRHYRMMPEKIKVIPVLLDIKGIQARSREVSEYVFPDGEYYKIGFVGSLSREKNVTSLLKALSILRKQGLDIRLFIVGEGPEKDFLQDLAKKLAVESFAHFLGYQNNPYAIMKNFDVVITPSFYETFSYVMIEAIACGVPVISTRWKGCEDIYRNMENCLLVPVNDHGELACAIKRLIDQEELRSSLVEGGKELVRKCELNAVLEQYDEAIKGVLEG